ncbi:MAG: hypothetical protein ABJE95_13065, partial [Byssovorax sp.]
VVDELRKRGFKHTAVLDEGILEWKKREYPTLSDPSAPAAPVIAPQRLAPMVPPPAVQLNPLIVPH